jgi:hypothetical protein
MMNVSRERTDHWLWRAYVAALAFYALSPAIALGMVAWWVL